MAANEIFDVQDWAGGFSLATTIPKPHPSEPISDY